MVGTLPYQIGNLRRLKRVSISYNKLKGTIPSSVKNLKNLDLFHLHGNQLEGGADLFEEYYIPNSFIVDCGSTDISERLVDCSTCSECCNEKAGCVTLAKTWPGDTLESLELDHGITPYFTILFFILACWIFLFCVSFLMLLAKEKLPAMDCPFEEFQQDSINRFYLGNNKFGTFIALLTTVIQIVTTSIFFKAGDSASDTNDLSYSVR